MICIDCGMKVIPVREADASGAGYWLLKCPQCGDQIVSYTLTGLLRCQNKFKDKGVNYEQKPIS